MITRIEAPPFSYEVRWSDTHPRDAQGKAIDWDAKWGYTDHTHSVIYIHPDVNPYLARVILMHEILHAAAFVAGCAYDTELDEEDWVLRVSPILLNILDMNPELRKEWWP